MSSDMEKYGLFSLPPSLHVGDKYSDKKVERLREKGTTFKTGGPKTGANPDALFGSTGRLFDNEPYVEPEVFNRRERNKKLSKIIGPKWVNPQPMKKGKPGDLYGTLGGMPEHMPEYNRPPKARAAVKDTTVKPRAFQTAPTQAGGPGTTKRSIGDKEIEYVSSPYVAPAVGLKAGRGEDSKKFLGGSFRTGRRVGDTFDDGSVYREYTPKVSRKKKAKRERPKPKMIAGPFKPSNPITPRDNAPMTMGLIGGVPQYKGDGEVELPRSRSARGPAKPKPFIGGQWKPNSGPKSVNTGAQTHRKSGSQTARL